MQHRAILILPILGIVLVIIGSPAHSLEAQSNTQVLTHYAQAVYSEPDRAYSIIGVLVPQAKVVLEARNADTAWVLGHTPDGAVRGWMESRFLDIPTDVSLPKLLVSNEIMFVSSIDAPASAAYISINLSNYPIIPTSMGRGRETFELGHSHGNNAHAVSKVGDCISDNEHFLSPFGWRQYNLGNYAGLQTVIDQFSESLAYNSLAAYDGLVTSAVLDPLFANPLACQPGETPLRCEYRIHQSSVAIIMFGAQDLLFTPSDAFNQNLRQIVHETIQAGVIPVLSTFPGNLERWEQSIQYNQIVVQVALDYDIPLMNLWLGLEQLPNHGLNADGRHLSLPITKSGDFSSANLQRGYPLRNLVTLQTLDAVWRSVMY